MENHRGGTSMDAATPVAMTKPKTHATSVDGQPAGTLAGRFFHGHPGLAKGFLAALATKLRDDADRDAKDGRRQLAETGTRAAEALDRASEMIPGGSAEGMDKLAETVGNLRYDALRAAVAGFDKGAEKFLRELANGGPAAAEGSSFPSAFPGTVAAFRSQIEEARAAIDRAWRLSVRRMGFHLDGTPLGTAEKTAEILNAPAPAPTDHAPAEAHEIGAGSSAETTPATAARRPGGIPSIAALF